MKTRKPLHSAENSRQTASDHNISMKCEDLLGEDTTEFDTKILPKHRRPSRKQSVYTQLPAYSDHPVSGMKQEANHESGEPVEHQEVSGGQEATAESHRDATTSTTPPSAVERAPLTTSAQNAIAATNPTYKEIAIAVLLIFLSLGSLRSYLTFTPRAIRHARGAPLAVGLSEIGEQINAIRASIHQQTTSAPQGYIGGIDEAIDTLIRCEGLLEDLGLQLGVNLAFQIKDAARPARCHHLGPLLPSCRKVAAYADGAVRCLTSACSSLQTTQAGIERGVSDAEEYVATSKEAIIAKYKVVDGWRVRPNLLRKFQQGESEPKRSFDETQVQEASHRVLSGLKSDIIDALVTLEHKKGLISGLTRGLYGLCGQLDKWQGSSQGDWDSQEQCTPSDVGIVEARFVTAVSEALGDEDRAVSFTAYNQAL